MLANGLWRGETGPTGAGQGENGASKTSMDTTNVQAGIRVCLSMSLCAGYGQPFARLRPWWLGCWSCAVV